MSTPFCPGYGSEPFRTLVADCPGPEAYVPDAFRVEWGPVFHRGRLDGTARLLVIGQDPAQHETVARRILMGEAGRRVQGFLQRLALDGAYVMVNTFAYPVWDQHAASVLVNDPAIDGYRSRWFGALVDTGGLRGVVAFGSLADRAWRHWRASAAAAARPAVSTLIYRHVAHPTSPEAAGGDVAAATKAMLQAWTAALRDLAPVVTPGLQPQDVAAYGDAFADADKPPIPPADLAAGSPPWMGTATDWAIRDGATSQEKRFSIRVTAPH